MKYLLKKNSEDEGVLCDLIVFENYFYYIGDQPKRVGRLCYNENHRRIEYYSGLNDKDIQLAIVATNNPNTRIPKVVDEVDIMREKLVETYLEKIKDATKRFFWKVGFKHGYNKSQETHSNSDEDMIEFGKHCIRQFTLSQNRDESFTKRLLPEWREQQHKVVYYHD